MLMSDFKSFKILILHNIGDMTVKASDLTGQAHLLFFNITPSIRFKSF